MRRGDYIMLAAALRSARPVRNAIPQWLTWQATCVAITDALEQQAPGFNRYVFLQNCGVTT